MAHNFVRLYLVDGLLEVDLAQVGALAPVHDANLSGRDAFTSGCKYIVSIFSSNLTLEKLKICNYH